MQPELPLEDRLLKMRACQSQIANDLLLLDKLIYHQETSYLKDTFHFGNIIKGWDQPNNN